MRKGLQNIENNENRNYRIIAVDDEEGIVDSLSIFLKRYKRCMNEFDNWIDEKRGEEE